MKSDRHVAGPNEPGVVRRLESERDELTVVLSNLRAEHKRVVDDLLTQLDRQTSLRDAAREERNKAQIEVSSLSARLNAMNRAVVRLHKATRTNAGEEAECWREIDRLLRNE